MLQLIKNEFERLTTEQKTMRDYFSNFKMIISKALADGTLVTDNKTI